MLTPPAAMTSPSKNREKKSDIATNTSNDLTRLQSHGIGAVESSDQLLRKLGNRQIQLIAIGTPSKNTIQALHETDTQNRRFYWYRSFR